GFVHRNHRIAIAVDAGPVAQGLGDRFADGDAGILGGVMEVDMKIALRLHIEVDQAVAGELLQHVIQETDAGRDFRPAGAVEIDGNRDLGLLGLARHRSLPHRPNPSIRSFCASFLARMVYLRQPIGYGSHSTTGSIAVLEESRPLTYFGSMRDENDNTHGMAAWHGTTILLVRKGADVVIAGDGQVSVGPTVMKSNAKKLRRLGKGEVIAGFAGATADALTLFERLEAKLEQHPGQLARACVELAKDWRTDRYLRRLEAMMAVADKSVSLVLTGTGDVLEPEDGLIGIGSGGSFALSAARALIDLEGFDAETIVRKAMKIAGDICIYTNHNIT